MQKSEKINSKVIGQTLWNLLLITTGSILGAIAVKSILAPLEFFGTGFTGIALIISYLVPSVPISAIYFIINIPVYILGWKFVGRGFFFYSIIAMVLFSIALQFINFQITIQDKILGAILAGITMGTAAGLTLKSQGSGGGLDILSVIFLRIFSVSLGTTILAFNTAILLAGAILFSLERALYTLIFIFITSNIVNLVVNGLSQRRTALIISSRWEEISKAIMEEIDRGVTILTGRGAYSNQEQNVLYTIITYRELPQIKKVVREIDPDAIVVVNETLEVMGYRIGNQPHW
ncbi:MAG: YitT family protein [Desulfobacteraceae bacterium]